MLTRLFHYSVALGLSAVVLFSCRGKDGDPGPQGDAGAAGTTGAKGQPGGSAVLYTKSGFVRGTLSGLRADGVTPINESFDYQFRRETNSLSTPDNYANGTVVRDTEQAGLYKFSIERADSSSGGTLRLAFKAPLDLSQDAVVTSAYFNFNKDLGNNEVMGVDGNFTLMRGQAPPTVQVTNVRYSRSSGLLTGDFYWEAGEGTVSTTLYQYHSFSGSGKPFTVSGSFSVQAPLVTSFRKGAPSN